MLLLLSVCGVVSFLAARVFAQSPSPPLGKGTSFLDHDALLSGFFGQTFLKDNIPFIDIPDSLIQDVYYYRWTSLQRNLRYVMPGAGWMCTEFLQPVSYAMAFGSINAAAGHHIDEAKWLRSSHYADDYIQLYTRGLANSTQYTEWILHAMDQQSRVTGNKEIFTAQLNDMIQLWHEWDSVFDENVGLYYYKPVWDAQELSLPGYIHDPKDKKGSRSDGPDTFRPSHNAYMVAGARAISSAARLANEGHIESEFNRLANTLEANMYRRLWAPEQKFFMDVIRPENPNLTTLSSREQVGLFPYRFGIGLDQQHAQPAVDSMFDLEGFLAPYGPTTLETRSSFFMPEKPDDYCCYWNGQSWPYSTSHTLKSLASIYRSSKTNVTAEQYYQYLYTYAKTQRKNGQPYIAESHLPYNDSWSADSRNHSEHYAHSTYTDDVITGLLGILPQHEDTLLVSPIVPENWTYFGIENVPYHGHLITVLYDKDGSRYNQGAGLSVFIDGENVGSIEGKNASVDMPPPIKSSSDVLVNIAANPTGPGQYPQANATWTNPGDFYYKAIDGRLFYDDIPDNRWTNFLSPNMNDTFTVTFARPRKVKSVTLALFSDVARGGAVDLPACIEVYDASGRLLGSVNDTSQLLPNDRNKIAFDEEVETTSLAVNLHRRSASVYVGICELEVWVPPETGPDYPAADAYLLGASTRVLYENDGTAVVGGLANDSTVVFPGIVSREKDPAAALILSYLHNGTAPITLAVKVNNMPPVNISLTATTGSMYGRHGGNTYGEAIAKVSLAAGKNWIKLDGDFLGVDEEIKNAVRIKTLTVQSSAS